MIACWRCMRREVPLALEMCTHCRRAEYRRNYEHENNPSPTSESAHRQRRMPPEVAEWEALRKAQGGRGRHKGGD